MVTTAEQTKANAQKAADLIREHGWCQGKRNQQGAMCAKEAMERVCVIEHPTLGPMSAGLCDLADAFRAETNGAGIIAFNDTPGRTKEEVLEVFDRIGM
jgi:hypothetical protein